MVKSVPLSINNVINEIDCEVVPCIIEISMIQLFVRFATSLREPRWKIALINFEKDELQYFLWQEKKGE